MFEEDEEKEGKTSEVKLSAVIERRESRPCIVIAVPMGKMFR